MSYRISVLAFILHLFVLLNFFFLIFCCSKEKLVVIESLKNEKNIADVENEAAQQVSPITFSTFMDVTCEC